MGVGGQRHAPTALPSEKRPGTHRIGGRVGQRAGLNGCGKSRPTGIRFPDRPARSESLYQLSYPSPHARCIKTRRRQGRSVFLENATLENERDSFLINVGNHLANDTGSHPTGRNPQIVGLLIPFTLNTSVPRQVGKESERETLTH